VLRIGTSGYAYPKWRPDFYPAGASSEDMLRFYAERFDVVEINNTFYRMPKASVLAGWAALVPSTFRFVLKASRRITHQNRLVDAQDNVEYLYTQARVLGDHLGGVLFQLPPNLRKDVDRLRSFAACLPDDARAVFEFRHASWFDEEVYQVLRAARCALCVADAGEGLPEAPLVDLTDEGYVRLRRPEYSDDEMRAWIERTTTAWPNADLVFMHEDETDAPRLALRCRGLRDAPTTPQTNPPTETPAR
jgi:uncharacterized protein YecE (DUF72 family)